MDDWTTREPEKAVIFVGALYSINDVFVSAASVLQRKFGGLLFESPALPWNYSSYYHEELGAPLYRNFIFFDSPTGASSIVEAKRVTYEIEQQFSVANKRRINLDPGYLSLAKVVLASRKNYSHRIYLGRGTYAELELFYKDGRFHPMPYTYLDYKDETFLPLFAEARRRFKKMLGRAAED